MNNAGGAFGLDPVESADLDHWRQMYELNVLGTLRVTQALLPQLREGDGGDIVVVTSTAAHGTYEGGAGYVGAKHAERMLATTLRWEILGEPIRIIEIAPGAVATEEFSMVRFDGDGERAAAVYAGYEPLVADDIADAIAWSLSRPGARQHRPAGGPPARAGEQQPDRADRPPEIDRATVGGRT